MITLNGKQIVPAAITFNTLCALEENGAPIETWSALNLGLIRAYLAVSAGVTAPAAGDMIESHMIAGGTLDELYAAFNAEMESSGFFAALLKRRAAANGAD